MERNPELMAELARQAEAQKEKNEREATVGAKIAGIKGNPGETRSETEIRKQAEEETDSGISVG